MLDVDEQSSESSFAFVGVAAHSSKVVKKQLWAILDEDELPQPLNELVTEEFVSFNDAVFFKNVVKGHDCPVVVLNEFLETRLPQCDLVVQLWEQE